MAGQVTVTALGSLVSIRIEGEDINSGTAKKISFTMDADQAHDLAHELLSKITAGLPDVDRPHDILASRDGATGLWLHECTACGTSTLGHAPPLPCAGGDSHA